MGKMKSIRVGRYPDQGCSRIGDKDQVRVACTKVNRLGAGSKKISKPY